MTLEEFQSQMTVIYSKSTGKIKAIFTGPQEMQVLYGDEAQEYMQIWDRVVVTNDQRVVSFPELFKINLETKQIETLPSEYPIASS